MNKRQLSVLTDVERLLVLETGRNELAALDEDELMELHGRIRQVRNKYTGQYRRTGAAKVPAKGGRGKAAQQNSRAREKAEVFEDALSRVSTSLARAARASASALKAERIAAARGAKGSSPVAAAGRRDPASPATATLKQTRSDASAVSKKNASTLAMGARRQVKRDTKRAAATAKAR
jgi:hypothetical protein